MALNATCNFLSQQIACFSMAERLDRGQMVALGAASVLLPLLLQVCQLALEYFGTVYGRQEQRPQGVLQRLAKGLEACRMDGVEGHAALADLLQQTPRRMVLVAEEAHVHQGQTQQRRLQVANHLTYRLQQMRVMRHVVYHERHDFQAQRLRQVLGASAQRQPLTFQRMGLRLRLIAFDFAALFQALHHPLDLLHLGQGFQCSRNGELKSVIRGSGRRKVINFELPGKLLGKLIHTTDRLAGYRFAGQQLAQLVQRQQGGVAANAVRARPSAHLLLHIATHGRCPAFGSSAWHRCHRFVPGPHIGHGIGHRNYAFLAQLAT
jgi:hypothetical protein